MALIGTNTTSLGCLKVTDKHPEDKQICAEPIRPEAAIELVIAMISHDRGVYDNKVFISALRVAFPGTIERCNDVFTLEEAMGGRMTFMGTDHVVELATMFMEISAALHQYRGPVSD